jgi:hypothetical protein
MPRRPGVYPDDYPPERRNAKIVPVPGQPLNPALPPPAIRLVRRSASNCALPSKDVTPNLLAAPEDHGTSPAKPEAAEAKKFIDRATTSRQQRHTIDLIRLKSAYADFPQVPVKPIKFKSIPKRYPSGAATGTERWSPFEDKLRDLFLTQAMEAPR